MKKILLLVFAIFATLVLVGCEPKEIRGKDDLEKFIYYYQDENAESYELNLSMTIIGQISEKLEFDGNLVHSTFNMWGDIEETYEELVDNGKYVYSKDENGVWTYTFEETEEVESDVPFDFNDITYDSFEKTEDGKYVLKSEFVQQVGCSLTITISDKGKSAEIVGTMTDGIFNAQFILNTSNYGKVKVTLPIQRTE